MGLARIALHGVHRVQGFGGSRVGIGDAILAVARHAAHAAAEQYDRQDYRRDSDRRKTGEPRTGDREHHRRAEYRHHAAQRDRCAGCNHGAQQFGIGRQPRDQFAAAGALEKRHVHPHQAIVKLAAQVGDHALAKQAHTIKTRRGRYRQHQRYAEQGEKPDVDRSRLRVVGEGFSKSAVDHVTHCDRQGQRRGRGQRQESQPAGDQARVAAHERP